MRATSLMPDDADTDMGRPKKADDDVFVEAVNALDPVGTGGIRERVAEKTGWDLDQSTAYRRLEDLSDRGKIVKKKESGKATWLSKDSYAAVVSDEVFLDALRKLDKLNTTEEIAEEAGFDETSTLERLQKLEREGKVTSRNQDGEGDTLWTPVE